MRNTIRSGVPWARARLASLRALARGAQSGVLACMLALVVLCGAVQPAAAGPVQERALKAAFLVKFLGYVDFAAGSPGATVGPVVIGVVGADDVAAELARVAAHNAGNRQITVKVLRPHDSLAGLNMLFIGGGEYDRAERLLRLAPGQGVLTVTEFDGGLREGSVINFRLVDERVRFEVSLAAAEKANLKLSSRLLSVAYLVQR